jgi:hypothetical protein
MDTMKKILTAILVAGVAAAMTISVADARQGCGAGRHWSARYGHCVRNHYHPMPMAPAYAPPPPTRVQTITPPAQTGVIPNPGNSVCPYGYHPTAPGKCAPN